MKYKNLSIQQHKFVQLHLKGLTQVLAYSTVYGIDISTDAGHANASSSASTLLRNPKIMHHIDTVLKRRFEKIEISEQRLLAELLNISLVDTRDFYDHDTGDLKPINELNIAQQAAISEIEIEALYEGKGKDRVQIGHTKKVKFHPKNKSIEMLLKKLGFLSDDKQGKDVNVKVNVFPETTHVFQDINHGNEQLADRDQIVYAKKGPGHNRVKLQGEGT